VALPAGAAEDTGDWSLCRANALLEFYVPDLATDVDPETVPTDFEADQVLVEGPEEARKYTLSGDAVVTNAGQRIAADVLRYDLGTGVAEAEGNVRYQDSAMLVGADKASGQVEKKTATLDNVRYQLIEARGNGTATKAQRLDADHTALDEVTFSTCDPGDRDWEIVAREMQLDHAEGKGTARGAKLRFKDVTLLALPYATFPIDDRRRSGFLVPSIGGSNDDGFDFAVPYYLNLAPNYDATLVPRIITDRGFMAGGEFRYLTRTQRGELAGTFLADDDRADRDRWSYRFDHVGVFNRYFHGVADINKVSDPRYFEDFGDGLTAAATSLLPSSAYLFGRGAWWTMAFGGDDYDVTDPELAPSDEPYRRLPRLALDAEYPVVDWFRVGLRSELVKFSKDDALEGERYDNTPYVAFPFERAAGYVRPEFGYRYTSYELDRPLNDSPSRSTSIASVDAGLFFDRDASWFGAPARQTLEPRLYYLHVPFEDQDDLPLFDTQELTFSFAQLFRPNRFTGADRQMDADQLSLALTTRLIDDAEGRERIRASVGQIRYFDDQEVQLPGAPPTDYSGSDYAAEVAFAAGRNTDVAWSQLYDPNDDHTDLSAIRLQHRFADKRGVVNATYRYRRGEFEQVDLSSAFPVTDNVRLVGRWLWDLNDERTLEAFAGVEYDTCCYLFRILGRHYVRNVEGEKANAIYLELELKGLGSLGRRSEEFLRQAIGGYRSDRP
jgi:LPS-assembly protein